MSPSANNNEPHFAEPRVVGQVRLYAVIRRSSQYRYQQRSKNPFEVHFGDYPGGYCVFGNDNQYRIEDLRFYVKLGEHWRALS